MKNTKPQKSFARVAGSVLLWVLAATGLLSGALWVGNLLGVVQPLIVVSGSMSPEIEKGDLLFATSTPAGQLRVGQVATLPSSLDGVLVTHRIVELERVGDTVTLRMQGDANDAPDGEQHVLASTDPVWTPRVTIPGAGGVVETLMLPMVGIPLLVGLFALASLSWLPRPEREDAASEIAGDSPAQPTTRREKVTA